jgi:hypothetical protein
MARHDFVPLDPVDRGTFRAIVEHLAALPLRTATQRMADPGLFTEDGEVVTWWSPEMVLPVGDALRQYIAETEPKARRAQESMALRLVALPDDLRQGGA